jgi:uncharacterized phiE125 gp8 family phage protein
VSFALVLDTAPTRLLLTLEEAKSHLSIAEGCPCDSGEIERRIAEATADAERECGRQFVSATWLMAIDKFPGCGEPIRLPLGKTSAVASVKYYDVDGVQQTLSTDVYFAALVGEPARIVLRSGEAWPAIQYGRPEAVEIEYTVGWSTPEAVPADLKAAVKLILGERWANRGDGKEDRSIPAGARRILTAWRAHEVG